MTACVSPDRWCAADITARCLVNTQGHGNLLKEQSHEERLTARSQARATAPGGLGRSGRGIVPAGHRGLVRWLPGGIRPALPTAGPHRDAAPLEPGAPAQ